MEKPWYTSKTIWGTILASLGTALEKVPDQKVAQVGHALKVLGMLLAGIGVRSAIGKLY